jgi:hypothetical protein
LAQPQEVEALLFIGVNTGPSNLARRTDVRNSWMQDLKADSQVQARFIVGNPVGSDAHEVAAALETEENEHKDFLRLRVDDTYDTLTSKTFAFLSWFSSSDGPNARFLMKLDDDTFPHFDSLTTLLRTQPQEGYSYIGFFHQCAVVKRSGKNAESFVEFPEPMFPTYASGSGYVLSAPLVRDLVHGNGSTHSAARSDMPMLYNEDASVGVWVDREASRESVSLTPISATLFGCTPGDRLSMNLRLGEMTCMWKRRASGRSNYCCEDLSHDIGLLQASAKLKCHSSLMDVVSNRSATVTKVHNLTHALSLLKVRPSNLTLLDNSGDPNGLKVANRYSSWRGQSFVNLSRSTNSPRPNILSRVLKQSRLRDASNY